MRTFHKTKRPTVGAGRVIGTRNGQSSVREGSLEQETANRQSGIRHQETDVPVNGGIRKNMVFTGYLFVHFIGEQKDGEQIYFSLSRDGLHWEDLMGGRPVLRSGIGEGGARDPFIIRTPGRFYLIATDLRIEAGKGWEAAQ